MIKAAICTIGDEILIGQIVDTNSGEISRALQNAGIAVRCHISIADDREEILSTLADLARKCDVMITTGGLGPTRDDITKEALRILSGSAGYRNDVVQEGINREILGARGVAMSDINLAQSQVPERAEVIPNRLGTAPGMVFRGVVCRGVEGGAGATLYALPGVPFETRALIPQVISDICTHFETAPITHRTIVTFGIPESVLAKEIEDEERNLQQ